MSGVKTEVLAKDGIITLRGEAINSAQKELATEFAKDVEGVKNVKNEMTVVAPKEKTTGDKKESMGESIDDASTTALVKSTLLHHRSTSALNAKVETKEGVVNLIGKAKNSAEKDLVTKIVSDVQGVKKVDNNMSVE